MSKRIRPKIPLGALRALVKERTAAGERSVSVAFLLCWLDLEETLIDVRLRIGYARSAIARGDGIAAETQLEFLEAALDRLIDLP